MSEATALQRGATKGHRSPGLRGSPVDLYRVRRALWVGKWWLIGTGIVGVVAGFLLVKLTMSDVYETIVVLKYEGDLKSASARPSPHAIRPAADALQQQSVLREIRERTGFRGSLTALGRSIGYGVNTLAMTLQLSVYGATGEDAAAFARDVTDVFLTYHKERQSRGIEIEIARMTKRIEAAEAEAEEARHRYNEFREEHGIADLSTEEGSMIKSAAKLRADSELEMAEIRALEAEVRSLESQLTSTPRMTVVSSNAPERATYNRLRQELASARATLSPEHPQVQSLQQQVNQLGAQLRSGGGASPIGDGLVGANATYQAVEGQVRDAKARLAALRERQKGLSEMADQAQRRLEAFSDVEGEASALLAGVNVNESLAGELRRAEAALEDALHDPPSGFVVLDPGSVPEYPVPNSRKKIVLVAIPMLSIALMVLLLFMRELRGFLLETPAEIAFWGNAPVLGATTWPDDPYGLTELVAGLDDLVPHAKGSLLIIGGSPNESRIANELADRMNSDWFPTDAHAATPSTRQSEPTERVPLTTPPPAGPYPFRRAGAPSVALARLPSPPPVEPVHLTRSLDHFRLEAWNGPQEGQALRRAARLADRVVVLVRSGAISAPRVARVTHRIGREHGIGYIVVGLPNELCGLPDRVGDVAAFWSS